MTKEKIKNALETLDKLPVSLQNVCYEQGMPGFKFYVNGMLELPVDGDDEYYVRVKECYNGSSGIGFLLRDVLEVFKQPSGRVEITLK